MANDTEPFNRWDAAFRLAGSVILECADSLQSVREAVFDPLLLEGVERILANGESDKSLLAMALSLPEENYLAQQMEVIDLDNLHRTRLTSGGSGPRTEGRGSTH